MLQKVQLERSPLDICALKIPSLISSFIQRLFIEHLLCGPETEARIWMQVAYLGRRWGVIPGNMVGEQASETGTDRQAMKSVCCQAHYLCGQLRFNTTGELLRSTLNTGLCFPNQEG